MRILLRISLLIAAGASVLGAGCGKSSAGTRQGQGASGAAADTAVVPAPTPSPDDLLAAGTVALVGSAEWDALPPSGWARMAATSAAEQRAAERAAAAQPAPTDSVRVIRLQPGSVPGEARVAAGVPLGTPFETEVLHRFMGPDERFDLTFSGPAAGGGRQMPSVMRVSFMFHRSNLTNDVSVTLSGTGGTPSEVASEVLALKSAPDAFAHRIGVRYEPGRVTVFLDGEEVARAEARLGGGPMTATVTANTGPNTRAYLLGWTLSTGS